MSSGWKDATSDVMGGKEKKPKKVIHEIRTRKAKSGGYIHTHHHTSEHHPVEEHVSPDQASMLAHMAQAMPGPSAAPAPDASAGAPDAGAPDASAAPPAAAPAAPGM